MCICGVKAGFVLSERPCPSAEANFRDTCQTVNNSCGCETAALRGVHGISSKYRFPNTLLSLKRAVVKVIVLRGSAIPAQDSSEVISNNPLEECLEATGLYEISGDVFTGSEETI